MRLLGGGENSAAHCERKVDDDKESRGVQIILSGLIDHPELPMRCSISIRQHLVDLAAFQGHFIALVAKAESQLAFLGCHVSQDNA